MYNVQLIFVTSRGAVMLVMCKNGCKGVRINTFKSEKQNPLSENGFRMPKYTNIDETHRIKNDFPLGLIKYF